MENPDSFKKLNKAIYYWTILICGKLGKKAGERNPEILPDCNHFETNNRDMIQPKLNT